MAAAAASKKAVAGGMAEVAGTQGRAAIKVLLLLRPYGATGAEAAAPLASNPWRARIK